MNHKRIEPSPTPEPALTPTECRVLTGIGISLLLIVFWGFYFGTTYFAALRILESSDIQAIEESRPPFPD